MCDILIITQSGQSFLGNQDILYKIDFGRQHYVEDRGKIRATNWIKGLSYWRLCDVIQV